MDKREIVIAEYLTGGITYRRLGEKHGIDFRTINSWGPSVKTQMILAIEQHTDWVAGCLTYMRSHGCSRIEAEPQAQEAWVSHVNEVADKTLYPLANSWYIGANIPGKPKVFMPYVGGFVGYKSKCDEVAANGYEGFILK